MSSFFARLWKEECGVLSFEWVTLNSVVILGVVGGLASVRDAVNDEMADLTEAMTSLDQSYTILPPCGVAVGQVRNVGGNSRVQGQITEGAGYSSRAWQEFMTKNPDYAPALTGRTATASGAAGSVFMDTKPEVNRNLEPGAPAPVDQSGMIENVQ